MGDGKGGSAGRGRFGLHGAAGVPGPAVLGVAGREQPLHGGALRRVHAGSRLRARQHQQVQQHQHRRFAGERRRHQGHGQRQAGGRAGRLRLEAAGLSQDDRHAALGAAAGSAQAVGNFCGPGDQDRGGPRPLGPRRQPERLPERYAVHPEEPSWKASSGRSTIRNRTSAPTTSPAAASDACVRLSAQDAG